jgi:uncharacterized protein YecE (DUF72 family)
MGSIRIGLSSWTDKSLIESGKFYPAGMTDAEGRLRYYVSQFPRLVEVNSTYYGLPSERNAIAWAERTPDDFLFDVKMFSLLTQHPTQPRSLPKDMLQALDAGVRAKEQIYLNQVPPAIAGEIMKRFVAALTPLRAAGKLGAILLQFPRWFKAGRPALEHIAWCQEQLGDLRAAVEFRSADWLSDAKRADTLAFLKERRLTYVCVDEPQGLASSMPPLAVATTPQLAYVRFHGRRAGVWEKAGASVQERTQYVYSEAELREWVPKLRALAAEAEDVHVLMNTNFEDHAVLNARQLRLLLA